MERVVGGISIEAALCPSHVHIPAANFSRSSKHSSTLNLKTLPSFGGEDCGTLHNRLDRWVVRRIWSHRFKRWRCAGWKQLPAATLYREYGLVNLIRLIPSLASRYSDS